MSLSQISANHSTPRACAWQENAEYKRENTWEICLFAIRQQRGNIKSTNHIDHIAL